MQTDSVRVVFSMEAWHCSTSGCIVLKQMTATSNWIYIVVSTKTILFIPPRKGASNSYDSFECVTISYNVVFYHLFKKRRQQQYSIYYCHMMHTLYMSPLLTLYLDSCLLDICFHTFAHNLPQFLAILPETCLHHGI